LEEDLLVSQAGFDFLAHYSRGFNQPAVASSFSRFSHSSIKVGARQTSFPEQWGIAFNREFFEAFRKITADRTIQVSKVEHVFKQQFPSMPRFAMQATRFWTGLFVEALKNPSRPDALKAYTAIDLGIKFAVPWNSLSTDIAHLDARGMNARSKTDEENHEESTVDFYLDHCQRCEYSNARLNQGSKWVGTKLAQEFRIATRSGAWKKLKIADYLA